MFTDLQMLNQPFFQILQEAGAEFDPGPFSSARQQRDEVFQCYVTDYHWESIPKGLKGTLQAAAPCNQCLPPGEVEIQHIQHEILDIEEELQVKVFPEDHLEAGTTLGEKLSQCTRLWISHRRGGDAGPADGLDLGGWWLCLLLTFDECFDAWTELVFISWGEHLLPDIRDVTWRAGGNARLTWLRQRLRFLQEEADQAPQPHRPPRFGTAIHEAERWQTSQHVPSAYEAQEDWLNTLRATRWAILPREVVTPVYATLRAHFLIVHLFSGRRRADDTHCCLNSWAVKRNVTVTVRPAKLLAKPDTSNANLARMWSRSRDFHVLCALLRDFWGYTWTIRLRELEQLHAGSCFFLQTTLLIAYQLVTGGHFISEHPAPPKRQYPCIDLDLAVDQPPTPKFSSLWSRNGGLVLRCPSRLVYLYVYQAFCGPCTAKLKCHWQSPRLSQLADMRMGHLRPDLPTRKKVIDRILGPLAPSSEDFSHALEDIHRFSLLCRHFPPGLEGPVLFHLISKAKISTQVLHEKLQTMICQLFQKHGQELKLGLTPTWSQFASWLLEAQTRWAKASLELPYSFAMWVVDNLEELHKSLPKTRFFSTRTLSRDRSPKSEKNDLSWLFLGTRTLDQSAMRNDFVPQGETDFFDFFHYMRCETEEDLREAAQKMQEHFAVLDKGERHFSVAEELVLAYLALREVQGVKDLTCLQASAAWLHCAQLWHRCCQAESEAVGQVVRLLRKSQVQISNLKHIAIPSLDTLWHRALSLWPQTSAESHLPGVFLCDILACECELPSATAVRALHHFLLRFTFREGAELMWTSATGVCLLDRSGLQEGLLLKTSAGPIFLQLRILLSPGVVANALDFFKTLEIGGFLPLQVRSLWVRWLQLELSLRKAVKAKSSRALKAAIDQACQELEKDGLKAFAGKWLDRIEELSKLLKHWLKNERRAEEDLADDLEYRAEMAQIASATQQFRIDVTQLAENRSMYWREKVDTAA
eukprot:s830_g11.t1